MSQTAPTISKSSSPGIDRSSLDLGRLVGRRVLIYSMQYPGRPLIARVVQSEDGKMFLERTANNADLDNLVTNQKVTVKFEYKQQEVSTSALFKRTDGGHATIVLGQTVQPLKRRRFMRVPCQQPINLAVLPATGFRKSKIKQLRWIQTNLADFASGGVLLNINNCLQETTYLFVSLKLQSCDFPKLLLGKVRHCHQVDSGQFRVGLEFIISENKRDHFSRSLLENLPPSALEYSYLHRKSLNGHVSAWMLRNSQKKEQGYFK